MMSGLDLLREIHPIIWNLKGRPCLACRLRTAPCVEYMERRMKKTLHTLNQCWSLEGGERTYFDEYDGS